MQALVSDIQRRLGGPNPSDDESRPLLLELLGHKDLKSHILDLQEDDLRGFVELLDEVHKSDIQIRQC
jgi:hypothetical protein